MSWEDFKNKNEQELIVLLSEKRHELRGLQFQVHSRHLKQMNKISFVKKDIARISMLLTGFSKKK